MVGVLFKKVGDGIEYGGKSDNEILLVRKISNIDQSIDRKYIK